MSINVSLLLCSLFAPSTLAYISATGRHGAAVVGRTRGAPHLRMAASEPTTVQLTDAQLKAFGPPMTRPLTYIEEEGEESGEASAIWTSRTSTSNQLEGWVGGDYRLPSLQADSPASQFDPMGISNAIPVGYLREAELKHGRFAMLGFLGYVSVDLGLRWPGVDPALNSFDAWQNDFAKAPGAWAILFLAAFFEAVIGAPRVRAVDYDEREYAPTLKAEFSPGDFALDPFGFSNSDDDTKYKFQMQELKHGRLAMLAIAGIWAQGYATGVHEFPYF